MTRAPDATAIWMARDPTPEEAAPTSTVSPGWRRPLVIKARHAVSPAIGSAAASRQLRWAAWGRRWPPAP